jgi:kynurenine formamidase
MRSEPTETEILEYFERHSNWGRWGEGDQRGTVNLIDATKRVEAARSVQSGETVPLGRPWNTEGGADNPNPAQLWTRVIGASEAEASIDFVGVNYHGFSTTHVDALCHYFWEGKMWNGRSAELVNSQGAQFSDVSVWSDGIVTRGVLLDIPRLRGQGYVALDQPVRGDELIAAADAQEVEVRPGDALCVYSGREKYFAAHSERMPGVHPSPGHHADVAPVLHQWDIGLLAWDFMDARPSGYPSVDSRIASSPVHAVALVAMGLPLVDNCLLEPLADRCREIGRSEFCFMVSPLNIKGATGSPANPLAIF